MIVYISGKMSGDNNFVEKFARAEEKLKAEGHEVINPAKVPMPRSASYEQILKADMAMLEAAEAIYMLRDWATSNGARTELGYALGKGIYIMTETDTQERKAEDPKEEAKEDQTEGETSDKGEVIVGEDSARESLDKAEEGESVE